MSIKENRRANLRLLAKALGGITELANFLGKSPSQISHLIGSCVTKNVGDKLAAEIEQAFAKDSGWLDWDYSGQEAEVLKSAIPPQYCCRVPILKKTDVVAWVQLPAQRNKDNHPYIFTHVLVGQAAYAYNVQTDSMEAPSGITFPQGGTLIIDPELPMKEGSYVLILLDREVEPIFRQLNYANAKPLLRALNPRYPIIELTERYLACGVVRQLVADPETVNNYHGIVSSY